MVNILIVDDEPNILDIEERIVQRYFKQNEIEDYEIQTAANGNIAIKLMESKDYDLLFLDYILKDVNEIDEILLDIIESLDVQTFEKYKHDISIALNLYTTFLKSLSDFGKIAQTLKLTQDLINNIDIDNYNEKKKRYIIETIRAILSDISDWKDMVFVKEEAVDVFYIVASNYNSYLQLKDLLLKTK